MKWWEGVLEIVALLSTFAFIYFVEWYVSRDAK